MKEVLEFIKANWQLIVAVLVFILSFILQLFKKKPVKVVNSIADYIQSIACEVINKVEALADGKKYVDFEGFITPKIDCAISLISKRLVDIFPFLDVSQYSAYIRYVIEEILSTPQKKGGSADGE